MARNSVAFALQSFSKTVSAAGTAEPLVANSLLADNVTIQALPGSDVAVGGPVAADVVYATDATLVGLKLAPGDSVEFPRIDLRHVYIDVSDNDEGVTVIYTPSKGSQK